MPTRRHWLRHVVLPLDSTVRPRLPLSDSDSVVSCNGNWQPLQEAVLAFQARCAPMVLDTARTTADVHAAADHLVRRGAAISECLANARRIRGIPWPAGTAKKDPVTLELSTTFATCDARSASLNPGVSSSLASSSGREILALRKHIRQSFLPPPRMELVRPSRPLLLMLVAVVCVDCLDWHLKPSGRR